MSDRIVMRVAESLVAGGPPGTAAEPEIIIGELDGPVGTAFATLLGDQVKGHSRVLAIMNTDIMVKPATYKIYKYFNGYCSRRYSKWSFGCCKKWRYSKRKS